MMMNAQMTPVIPSLLTGAGAYAGCTYGCIEGEYLKALTKMVYLNHRSFLPFIDALRTQNEGFPSSTIKPLPSPKNMQYIDRANTRYSVATSTAKKRNFPRKLVVQVLIPCVDYLFMIVTKILLWKQCIF